MFDIKSWITKKLVKKYAGSWIRGGMRVLGGALVGYGLADAELAETLTGSFAEVALNVLNLVLDNPDLLSGIYLSTFGQWWSLKEKKDKEGE